MEIRNDTKIGFPSSSFDKGRLRLRVKTPVQGKSFSVKAPASVTVRQLKMALEAYRGVNVTDHSLAVWRGGMGYERLKDDRRLDQYRLTNGDRLVLLSSFRTDSTASEKDSKSALVQLTEETNADLVKIIDSQMEEAGRSISNGTLACLSRLDVSEATETSGSTIRKWPLTKSMEESVTVSCQESTGTTERATVSDLLMQGKVNELRAKMEEIILHRQSSKVLSSESVSIDAPSSSHTFELSSRFVNDKMLSATSNESGIHPAISSNHPFVFEMDSVNSRSEDPPVARPVLLCDQCSDEAMAGNDGECGRCAGRFCNQHINRTDHSCRPTMRCSVCGDLVLIAGDRYKCSQCQKPFCRQHIGQSCNGGHKEHPQIGFKLINGCPPQ